VDRRVTPLAGPIRSQSGPGEQAKRPPPVEIAVQALDILGKAVLVLTLLGECPHCIGCVTIARRRPLAPRAATRVGES